MDEGRERIPRKTLNFFGEARYARAVSLVLLHACPPAVPLPNGSKHYIDIRIDAGTDQSVIRATLLRYTLKSLPVNILVCGKLAQKVEDLAAHSTLNSIPDKGFSRSSRSFWPSRSRTFHSWAAVGATVGASGNELEALDSAGATIADSPNQIPH